MITRILGEGASAGVHLIMTGDRSLLAGRISSLCEEKLAFKLADRDDYALAGLRRRDLPNAVPPGRAFRAGSGIEVQVALLGAGRAGPGPGRGPAEQSPRTASAGTPRSRGRCGPSGWTRLPARMSFERRGQLRRTADYHELGRPCGGWWAWAATQLQRVGPDLGDGLPAFIVAGPSGAGRSTVLVAMTRSFLAAGTQVVSPHRDRRRCVRSPKPPERSACSRETRSMRKNSPPPWHPLTGLVSFSSMTPSCCETAMPQRS